MILVDKLIGGGIRFVLNTLVQAAENERDDAQSLREELLQAQMQLELGEIDEDQFIEIETDVSARLRAVREEARSSDESETRIAGIEVSLHDSVESD